MWMSLLSRFTEDCSAVWLQPLPKTTLASTGMLNAIPAGVMSFDFDEQSQAGIIPLLLHEEDRPLASLLHAGEVVALFEPEVWQTNFFFGLVILRPKIKGNVGQASTLLLWVVMLPIFHNA